jgi:dCMP deaminase
MPSINLLDTAYMQCAKSHAVLSHALRKQVGAVIVTNSGIIIPGYNGTPSGHNNACEDIVNVDPIDPKFNKLNFTKQLVTKPTVIHAELNCILKAAKEGVSVVGSTCYVTLLPCVQCSAMLCQAGIKRVVYAEDYRDISGIDVLKSSGIIVDQYKGDPYENYLN